MPIIQSITCASSLTFNKTVSPRHVYRLNTHISTSSHGNLISRFLFVVAAGFACNQCTLLVECIFSPSRNEPICLSADTTFTLLIIVHQVYITRWCLYFNSVSVRLFVLMRTRILWLPLVHVSSDSQSSQLAMTFPTSDVKHRIRILTSAKPVFPVKSS